MTFPHVIDGRSIIDHQKWIRDQADEIRNKFSSTGAILFRNFPIKSRQDLQDYVKCIIASDKPMTYFGGTSPRDEVANGIYTSTKMPFFLPIPLHSEMAYRNRFPGTIIFFCEKAPFMGGETPIVNLLKVHAEIPESVRNKLGNGIIYKRHLKNFTPIRKLLSRINPMIETGTWQHVFKSSDPGSVSAYCHDHGFEHEWLSDGSVILKTRLPSTIDDHWFNSVHFFQLHHRIWGRLFSALFKVFLLLTRNPDMSATSGNGERLADNEISQIVDAYENNKVVFRWETGDLLYLNNTLTAHGRNPYLGRRSILVSMANERSFSDA